LICAAPILLLWALANPITVWLNRPPKETHRLSQQDHELLETHALLIWRYFHEFGVKRHNYLIPDNVMQEGLAEAARVSPTNIGLLLNARQAACELGFLTAPEFSSLTSLTLATIDRMEQFHGHLYNWYDTETLQPLDKSPFVSSVDSGNLAASFYTLYAGTSELTKRPLLASQLFSGLRAHLHLLRTTGKMPAALSRIALPGHHAAVDAWVSWFIPAKAALMSAAASPSIRHEDVWWLQETLERVSAIQHLLDKYLPWALPQYASLRALSQLGINEQTSNLGPVEALAFAEHLYLALAHSRKSQAAGGTTTEPANTELANALHESLPAVIHRLQALIAELQRIERGAEKRAREMSFAFLVDPYRQILSIGYEMGVERRHPACYDLVASEARIATFLAIARGDLPKQSWQKLGRDHTKVYGHYLMLSWSGTMFEYLMPALWMRSYPGTLIARTQDACVQVQQEFGRELGILWGVSESASSRKNDRGHYHYFAFGLPSLSNWPEATAGPVVSPYSTFLTLSIDPKRALDNLHRMEAAGWMGTYGFYEAADYSVSSHAPALAREWMAHHQGMSLLAITNLLHHNVFQRWFHTHPLIQSTEMLLEEIPENTAILRSRLKESTPMRITSNARRPRASGVKAAL
jgi:cyclic beta-1,2-glucan synthetase